MRMFKFFGLTYQLATINFSSHQISKFYRRMEKLNKAVILKYHYYYDGTNWAKKGKHCWLCKRFQSMYCKKLHNKIRLRKMYHS